MNETIQVSIMSPDEVLWQGQVAALSSSNAEGVFDILPGHANFMTLIKNTKVTLHLKENQEQVFSLDQAVLFFNEDAAKVYVHTSVALAE